MVKSKHRVERDLRERLVRKGLTPDKVEEKVSRYMKEHDLKEHHRKIHMAGTSSIERAKANAVFEHEIWPKIKMDLLKGE